MRADWDVVLSADAGARNHTMRLTILGIVVLTAFSGCTFLKGILPGGSGETRKIPPASTVSTTSTIPVVPGTPGIPSGPPSPGSGGVSPGFPSPPSRVDPVSTTTTTIRLPGTGSPGWSSQGTSGSSESARSDRLRLDPIPEALTLGRESKDPSIRILVRAALAFSGVSGAALETGTLNLLELARREAAEVASVRDPARKAEMLLDSMHSRYLKRYVEEQSRLDTLLTAGTYNCVSSAVFFMILARSAGLDVQGISAPDHAFCILRLPGSTTFDIETTSRYGFDPGSRKEFHDAFGKITGFAYVSPNQYSRRVPASPGRLATFILSNRIADLDAQGKFAETVGPGVDYYVVEPDSAGRVFLFSRLRNAAGQMYDANEFLAVTNFSYEALVRYGEDARLRTLADSAAVLFASGQAVKLEKESGAYRAFLYLMSEKLPDTEDAAKLRSVYRHNAVVDEHNVFVSLYNARKFREARDHVRSALVRFPGEKSLLSDLAMVEKALGMP